MSGVFDGKSVLVSGTFSQPKTRISEAIRNAGGKVTTVIGRADFVVADTPTNKDTVAALKAGVPALSETWVADCVTAGNLIDDTKYYVSPLSAKVVATAAVAVATATATTTSTRPRRGAAAAATPVVSAPSAAAPAPTTTGRARRAAPTAAASATASAAAVAVAPPTKRGAQTAAAKAAAAATTAAVAAAASKLAAAPTVADAAAKAGGSVVAPVDAVCSLAGSFAVYQDKDGPWDAMLNQTNIGQNNNKFYLLQLLQNTSTGAYATWFRWGRVGLTGSYDLQHHSTLAGAQSYFRSKYSDKTVNAWRAPTFTARSGKYTLLVRDYVIVKEAETKKSAAAQKKFESKLPANIQSLVSLISDVQMMKKQMVKAGYDADRMPLGKLSKETLLEGYTVLSKIATIVNAPKKTASHRDELKELSSRFYTLIPHSFGMSVPPVLDTEKMVKEKVEMIESLAQIDTAIQIVKSEVPTENPIDTHYKKLKCAMGVVDKKSAEWKLVQEYLTNTHASTHSWYSLELKDVISLDREGEKARFDAGGFNKDKNRQLLWHGSRLSNFVGILSQGLRIAPPEAPVTGYMFGKGVYFADMISKSANYCAAQIGDDACLLLCEVALGTPNELKHSDYNANKLPKGKLSTKGLGSTFPGSHKVVEDGIKVPCGTPVTDSKGGSLLYNEFIVYDVAQIKMRYIVRVGFNRRK